LLYSSLCSGLLLLVYKLFFEKEKMHRFKRVYLLLAIIFSYVVPCVVVQQTVLPAVVTQPLIQTGSSLTAYARLTDTMHWQPIVIYIFLLISGFLFIRFIYNLYKFAAKVNTSKRCRYKHAILVLQEDAQVPHSFLRYIFIGKTAFENSETEKEILHHELAHVKQRHSYDILFIELIRCVLWYNPFLFYYKKCIQLNHEFLADESVVLSFGNIQSYQRILLEKVSRLSMISIVSRFDFGVTKKRLVMMGKKTPRKIILYKQLLLLPVIILSVYLFGQHIEVKEKTIQTVRELAFKNVITESGVQKNEQISSVKTKPVLPKEKPVRLSPLTNKLPRLESIPIKPEAGLNRLSPLSTGNVETQQ
jgi:bla regulator protein BlaR1